MVEGGTATLNEFISKDLWDEARIFTGKKIFHSGITAPELKDMEFIEKKEIGDDMLHIFKRINSR